MRFDRFFKQPEDDRTPGQRDRDKILYSNEFRRLVGVTQVASPAEGILHNRLTHSLEVAQIGRRVAEKLKRNQPKISKTLGLDEDIVEAVCLAHDLGHPPFGHIAEETLDNLVIKYGDYEGFDGNAQSFRISTKLALWGSGPEAHGFNLTRATLNGILKYPNFQNKSKSEDKWGAYSTEKEYFDWARPIQRKSKVKSVEAEIMDWADDTAYSVHDVEDFYCAGLIPLEKLILQDEIEIERFTKYVKSKKCGLTSDNITDVFKGLWGFFPAINKPYDGSRKIRGILRTVKSHLLSKFDKGIRLKMPAGPSGRLVELDEEIRTHIKVLKQLTWCYVIDNPSLATQQHGQKKIITTLYEIFLSELKAGNSKIFPFKFQDHLEFLELTGSPKSKKKVARAIADIISSMTENEAVQLHHRLSGISLGSILDNVAR